MILIGKILGRRNDGNSRSDTQEKENQNLASSTADNLNSNHFIMLFCYVPLMFLAKVFYQRLVKKTRPVFEILFYFISLLPHPTLIRQVEYKCSPTQQHGVSTSGHPHV